MKFATRICLPLFAMLAPLAANAGPVMDFTGIYDIATWTTTRAISNAPGAELGAGGSVDTSGAPASIVLIEPDIDPDDDEDEDGDQGFEYGIQFTNVAAEDSVFSFDWVYDISLDECCAAAYVYVGDLTTDSTDDESGNWLSSAQFDSPLAGSFSASIKAGQVFGWGVFTNDDCCGATFLTITNFRMTEPVVTSVPEAATLALLGLGLVGMGARRRKTA